MKWRNPTVPEESHSFILSSNSNNYLLNLNTISVFLMNVSQILFQQTTSAYCLNFIYEVDVAFKDL
jgi:hypothetical protein